METKKKCYPCNMVITEKSAQISLQDLLDHTAKKIFQTKSQAEISKKWQAAGRNKRTFEKKFKDWLEHTCIITFKECVDDSPHALPRIKGHALLRKG